MFHHGTYVYVDGESHYTLAEKCLKNQHGDTVTLPNARFPSGGYQYPTPIPALRLFWHNLPVRAVQCYDEHVHRMYYFTSYVGQPDGLHQAKVTIREAGFEPYVIHEEKDKQKQREGLLRTDGILIKPKGVDVALAVRALADASANLYQTCALFTSDIDYLPLIEVIRRLGKTVYVFGFSEGIQKDSAFMYAPDKFIDLGEFIRKHAHMTTR